MLNYKLSIRAGNNSVPGYFRGVVSALVAMRHVLVAAVCRLARYECGIAAKSASIYCTCTVAPVPPKTDGIAVKCVTFSLGPLGCSRRGIHASGNAAE